MAQVLHQSQSHFSSPSSTSSSLPTIPCALPTPHEASFCQPALINSEEEGEEEEEGRGGGGLKERRREREGYQLPLLAILVRSLVGGCRRSERDSADLMCSSNSAMEIGLPTNVRHVAHVTFDRFNGFLGLPVEFEPEVPRRPPSASTSVFGVSTESMQLSFDPRGNSVPTILLMMQRHLYAQGGLEAEGIFRINAGNSQEEYVRGQLNRGVVPDGIDVHCLAGLIKAWFRELPTGLLDSLSPEQVMQSQTEEQCIQLVHVLPPTEMALLDWAVNLMTDVAQLEHTNKMNARNVAMVFAPNMTQMSDPLTALMHAVQVMNFLKTLIIKTLRERQDSAVGPNPTFQLEPPDDNGHCNFSLPHLDEAKEENEEEQEFSAVEPEPGSPCHPEDQEDNATARAAQNLQSSPENTVHVRKLSSVNNLKPENPSRHNKVRKEPYVNSPKSGANPNICRIRSGQMGDQKLKKGPIKVIRTSQKSLGATKFSRMNSTDWVETWR